MISPRRKKIQVFGLDTCHQNWSGMCRGCLRLPQNLLRISKRHVFSRRSQAPRYKNKSPRYKQNPFKPPGRAGGVLFPQWFARKTFSASLVSFRGIYQRLSRSSPLLRIWLSRSSLLVLFSAVGLVRFCCFLLSRYCHWSAFAVWAVMV